MRKLIERRGEGVRLLPFLVAVLDLRSDLACAKAGVVDLVQAHDARVEAAQAARRAAQAAQERARADAELVERKRREMHSRHTLGEVDHLQQLVMSASGQLHVRPWQRRQQKLAEHCVMWRQHLPYGRRPMRRAV